MLRLSLSLSLSLCVCVCVCVLYVYIGTCALMLFCNHQTPQRRITYAIQPVSLSSMCTVSSSWSCWVSLRSRAQPPIRMV